MKSISTLTDFYYKTLYPTLTKLEEDRKKLRSRILTIGTLYTIISLLLFATFFDPHYIDINFIIFSGFAYIGVGSIIYKLLIKDYRSEFKEKVIAPLIKEIDQNLSYIPKIHIRPEHFTRSKLFTSKPDRVNGNDYVSGSIDGVKIEFSDFHAEKRHQDSKGRTSWSTLFQGLFIISEFPKEFQGTTVVLPDRAERNFGEYLGSWLQSNNFNRDQLIKMDSVAFEKEFVVYGTDQVEARYILTPLLMEKILHYKKRINENILLSFTNKKIYIAIDYNDDLFEPSVFHSLLKYKIAMQYIETLYLAIGIVDELKLNQKLWSKL